MHPIPSRLELNLTNLIFVCSLGLIFRTVRRQHCGTSTMIVHFCHVACSVDGFRVRLRLGRESGPGAFKSVMLCGYFEGKYLSWHNPLIKNVRRNNRLGKRNNEISLHAYDGMTTFWRGNLSRGGSCPGGSCPGGGQLSWGAIVLKG